MPIVRFPKFRIWSYVVPRSGITHIVREAPMSSGREFPWMAHAYCGVRVGFDKIMHEGWDTSSEGSTCPRCLGKLIRDVRQG